MLMPAPRLIKGESKTYRSVMLITLPKTRLANVKLFIAVIFRKPRRYPPFAALHDLHKH
jgi:hypothetical protein